MAQARPDALEAALKRSVPVIGWVHGDEPLLVQESADALRAAARREGVFEVDRSFKADRFAAEASALSLFGSARLLELRFSGKPGKEIGELIATSAEQADASLRLLVVSGRLDRTTTESAWFGRIDRAGLIVTVYPVERRELPRWIAHRLARQKQRADAATLELIAERVEGNLVEAMLSGDRERTLRSLEGLRAEGEAPPLLIWAIGDAVRSLMRLHAARDAGQALAQAMRSARIFGPRERIFDAAIRRISASDCEQALRSAALADRIVKGVADGDGWLALERLVMRLAGVPLPGES